MSVTRHDVQRAEEEEAREHSSLIQEIRFWGRRQFPNRTRAGIIEHLWSEILELKFSDWEDPREMADALHLLIQLADEQGYDIESVTRDKFNENKKRTWPTTPNAQGYFHHVEA